MYFSKGVLGNLLQQTRVHSTSINKLLLSVARLLTFWKSALALNAALKSATDDEEQGESFQLIRFGSKKLYI